MKPSQHRILQVITPSHIGGAERHLEWLAPRLRERGHDVHIVCKDRGHVVEEFRRALGAVNLEVQALPIRGKMNPRAFLALLRAIRCTKADFTHSHLSTASWLCGWLDQMGICPSVGHVQGFTNVNWHRWQRRLIACSQAVKEHMIAQGVRAERITVLPNPVDPINIRPRRSATVVRAEFGADEDTPVIGSFAHLSEKKGWREFIEAIPQVLRKHPQAQFWCVGEGNLRPELEASAQAGGFASNVRFLGFRRDVGDIMNAVDIMALPSYREPFGIVYVEAALLKKPAIACAAGGAPDVVVDGLTGLLVPPRQSQALAEAIVKLLDDPAQAASMGAVGYERALEHFGWPSFLNQLEHVYASVLEPQNGRRNLLVKAC
ncbi:MAG: glycosyltransferase family 4 protein [Abitibacteriaceae bacterium]|nr:glycosyltransferase family 4 protein [Abditibacteriaceae bacterium]